MAIELKEVLSYLGMAESDVTDMEKFKEKFSPVFIKKDVEIIRGDEDFHGKLLGATVGGINTAMERVLKKNGIKIDKKLLEGKKIHEVVESVIDSAASQYASKITELEASVGKGNDEKLTTLQKQLDTLKSEKETAEGKVIILQTEYDTFKTTKEKEVSELNLNSKVSPLWETYKWANGIKELEKEGFRSKIERKYKPALDESGSVIALNDKGEKVKDDKKADAFKSYEQVLQEEGIEAKVYAIADNRQQQRQPALKLPPENKIDAPAQIPDARRKISTMRPQTAAQ